MVYLARDEEFLPEADTEDEVDREMALLNKSGFGETVEDSEGSQNFRWMQKPEQR